MLSCLAGTVASLLWAVILLGFFLILFSLIFVQSVTQVLVDNGDSLSDDVKSGLYANFGSVGQGVLSLFQATSGGDDWSVSFRLLEKAGPSTQLLFVLYILFFMISVWNIVTSIYIDRAMKLAQPDLDHRVYQKQFDDMNDYFDLLEVVRELDYDKSGTISESEFMLFIHDERVMPKFQVRGIEVNNAKLFFSMLAAIAGTEEVDIRTFVKGLMRLKGQASSADLHILHFELRIAHQAFMKEAETQQLLLERLTFQLKSIEQRMVAERHRAVVSYQERPGTMI